MIKYRTNKQKNITIGLVLPHLKSRGSEKQALRLAKGFAEKGLRVVLFVVQGWGMEFMYQAFRNAGADVVNLGRPVRVGQKAVNLSRVFTLAWLARKYSCDILISRAFRSNQISGWAGLIAFIPTILVLSGPVLSKKSVRGFFNRLISMIRICKNYGFPIRIISVSRESAANFALSFPFFSKRVMAISNGVEISLEEQNADSSIRLNKEKFNICFSGSLELKRKGLDFLLDSMKHLVYDFGMSRACLILIGTGQDELELKNIVQEYGLINHVTFAGEQNNPFPIIKQCDVFILPSRQEGLPNALLEAMSLGICCISADCDTGPREIIENGRNGILVPVEDSRALAEAIIFLERNPDRRKQLAANGRRTISERFTYKAMIDAYFEMLKRIN